MKLIRPFVSGLLVCGIVLGMVSTLAAQTAQQGIAKVVNIHGSARYMTTDNQSWRPLKSGTILKPGAVVQTATESYVDVVLNNPNATAATVSLDAAQSSSPTTTAASNNNSPQAKAEQDAIRIYENTVLGIDKLTITQTGADKVTETQLDLKAGRILGTVKKLSAASRYEIKVPNGVAGIRGTIYSLSADGVLSVLSGSVLISSVGPDGTPVTKQVNAGEQYDTKNGKITPIPDAVLNSLLNDVNQLQSQAGTFKVSTTSAKDPTVYYVSPTKG